MKLVFATIATLMAGAPALAQEVSACDDWRASVRGLAEPWEQNTRTFANGKTRLALLDFGEPAAGPVHILILSPPYDELGDRQCRIVSARGTIGFYDLDFSGLQATYDPAIGLGFAIPGRSYLPETDSSAPMYLLITLNQATGDIQARVQVTGG